MSATLFMGRAVDPATGTKKSEPFLLDADDLTTHGLIVGMTGSGKTALGIVLIEELLKKGISVLAIDPKGDLGNLLLDFPNLSPAEFAPWVDAGSGATAEGESRKWTEGLAGWGLGPKDVSALAASREAVLYTPGSTSGVPIDLLGSLAPPSQASDEEDRRDLIAAFIGGLLGLIGVDADPIRSRPFILLSRCVEELWSQGETASVEALIRTAAAPPFTSVGALPLDTFFPSHDRQELVLELNNLLASSSTAAFRTGEPLDVGKMLSNAGGKPRLSIVSIASLSDPERVFVVATLLSRVKSWMRTQSGTSSLRALVYIDEIFGFFPPTAEPASKRPLLTLLKQARAFGVGLVLATQNPVDLDYKGLANCGAWWIGTLQTERDRKRLSDGLAAAGGPVDQDALLSATKKRVFLLHDIHRPAATLVETRWAMSYLRGPMTRDEIVRARTTGLTQAQAAPSAGAGSAGAVSPDGSLPPVPGGWPSRFVNLRGADIATPNLFVKYAVRYRTVGGTSPETTGVKLFSLDAASPGEVMENEAQDLTVDALDEAAPKKVRYAPLPAWLGAAGVKSAEKAVRERIADKLATELLKDPVTGTLSVPGESAEAFAGRLATVQAPAKVREALEKKRRDLAAAESAEKSRSLETYAGMAGAAIDMLGGLLGKRKTLRTSKVSSVLSKRRMEATAESRVATLRDEIAELEAKAAPPDPDRFVKVPVVPLKAHVDLLSIGIAWTT
ncbi:MAG: helicase HerA-like domain-containing protein [Thermoanaerobaculia bacterium]